jgi:hypothetical protein
MTHETDQHGMSPYKIARDLDAPAGENIWIAKMMPRHPGDAGMKATPQMVADFLAAPELYYAKHLRDFEYMGFSVEYLTPEQIRDMNLPESMFGHWCPKCSAPWPDALIRMQEAIEETTISVDPETGRWSSSSSGYEDLNKPEHWWHCNECSDVVAVDAAGRDLDDLFESMLDDLFEAMKSWSSQRDDEAITRAMEEAAQLEGIRKTQEAIGRGELCPHCQSPMPDNLRMNRDADVIYEVDQDANGVVSMIATGISMFDHTDFSCSACNSEIEPHPSWGKIIDSAKEAVLR